MSLPHLAPVHGVRDNAAYSNLAQIRPLLKSAVARRAAAVSDAQAEARLKNVVERTNAVLDRLELRQAELAREIKALTKRKNAAAQRAERIEDRVLTLMDEAGVTQVAGIRCSMRSQLAAPSLDVIDASKIPREHMRQPKTPPPEPDKTAIKKALGEREDLSPAEWGVRLTQKVSLIRK